MITLADFQKLDIRIGKVLEVEKVPNSDKLLKFNFDVGDRKLQILSAIADFVSNPLDLMGKEMPLLVNLEPRVMRGVESQGMILMADVDGKPVFLLPEEEVPSGSSVK